VILTAILGDLSVRDYRLVFGTGIAPDELRVTAHQKRYLP
jgi:hypothetical protein